MFEYLKCNPFYSMVSFFKEELQKYNGNVFVQNATRVYTRTEPAKHFVYFARENNTNIVPNHYFCADCNELVESKQSNGSNPLHRHLVGCTKSFVDLTTSEFTILMSKVLGMFGMDIPMEVLQRKLMEIGKINADTMNEVVDCIPKFQARIEKPTVKKPSMMHNMYFFNPL